MRHLGRFLILTGIAAWLFAGALRPDARPGAPNTLSLSAVDFLARPATGASAPRQLARIDAPPRRASHAPPAGAGAACIGAGQALASTATFAAADASGSAGPCALRAYVLGYDATAPPARA